MHLSPFRMSKLKAKFVLTYYPANRTSPDVTVTLVGRCAAAAAVSIAINMLSKCIAAVGSSIRHRQPNYYINATPVAGGRAIHWPAGSSRSWRQYSHHAIASLSRYQPPSVGLIDETLLQLHFQHFGLRSMYFYRATAMLSAVYAVVVCLCVCVSVTLRYCIKTAKHTCRITQTTLHDSPMTLVFWCQSSLRNSNGITPYGGDKCSWGGLKFVTFDEKRAITRKRYKIDA